MDRHANLPDDPAECHRLLWAAHQESVEQVAELRRVLDETAASYEELRQETGHASCRPQHAANCGVQKPSRC
jgi:plasmid stability protein